MALELLSTDAMLHELAVSCIAVLGLSAALIVQCGGNKRTQPKKTLQSSGSKSSKSKPGSSSKSAKSKPGPSSKSAKSKRDLSRKSAKSKSDLSRKSSKAKKSLKRTGKDAKRSAKDVKDVAKESANYVKESGKEAAQQAKDKSARTARSIKDAAVQKAKELAPEKDTESDKRRELVTSRLKPEEQRSIKSLEETQKSTNQKGALSKFASSLGLSMEPQKLRFGEEGGLQHVELHNPTDERYAIKVKCSDNNLYQVNPVYSIIEPRQRLDVAIVRQSGQQKLDKLVFVTTKAPAEDVDLKKLFKEAPARETPKILLPLMA